MSTGNASPPPPPSAAADQKIALEQYRNVIGYLQYENTMYWTRAGFMLVTQAALITSLARLLPISPSKVDWGVVAVTIGLGILGLILCYLWNQVIDGTLWWIDRWHRILVQIKPNAYGDIKVFRGAVDKTEQHPGRTPTKPIVKAVMRLFTAVWLIVLVAGVVGAVTILCRSQPTQPNERPQFLQSGRFQAIQVGGKVQLLDTATGRIVPDGDPDFGKDLSK